VACLIELSYIERIDLVEFWQYFYKVSGYQILPNNRNCTWNLNSHSYITSFTCDALWGQHC